MNLGPDPSTTEQRMSDCTSAVSKWLMSNGLLLNPAKSEVIRTGTSAQLNKINNDPVTVAGVPVSPKTHIKMLGVTFDSRLNFEKHVTETCSTASYHLRGLRHIRKVLDKQTANTIACSIVNSRLDYCNSVLAGINDYNINRLQRIQNSAARVVANVGTRHSVTSTLRELHWLPVAQRIDFKVALTTFKVLTTSTPSYLRCHLVNYTPTRTLRSSSNNLLAIPVCNTVLASRAFCVYAPRLWNSFPHYIRETVIDNANSGSISIEAFKRMLKTFFFTVAIDRGAL